MHSIIFKPIPRYVRHNACLTHWMVWVSQCLLYTPNAVSESVLGAAIWMVAICVLWMSNMCRVSQCLMWWCEWVSAWCDGVSETLITRLKTPTSTQPCPLCTVPRAHGETILKSWNHIIKNWWRHSAAKRVMIGNDIRYVVSSIY